MTREDDDRGLVVVIRSGKVEIKNVPINEEAQIHEQEKGMKGEKVPIHQRIAKGPQKICEETQSNPKVCATFTKSISSIS